MRAHVWLLLSMVLCCDDDLYQACEVAADCDEPEGRTPACVYKSGEGFCSWLCGVDADCEIGDGVVYLCAPFETNPAKYCFVSCETQVCPADHDCRNTGGGAENRKLCFPRVE